jgi:hypothetical protein
MIALVRASTPTDALAELEQIISDGLRTFVEVGSALARIRDEKLYAAEHKTFEAYVRVRFDMKRRYAYYVIAAAAVVHNCAQAGLPPPSNEAQARELAKLAKPVDQVQAWKEAVSTAPTDCEVTAQRVAFVVKNMPARLKRQPDRLPTPPRQVRDQKLNSYVANQQRMVDQRNADPEFASLRHTQKAVGAALPSRAQRMLDFILDGGELALLRLGLDWTVTSESLMQAYREKSRDHHPDRGGLPGAFEQLTRDRDLVLSLIVGTP